MTLEETIEYTLRGESPRRNAALRPPGHVRVPRGEVKALLVRRRSGGRAGLTRCAASALLVGIARSARLLATAILRRRLHLRLWSRLRDLPLWSRLVDLPLRNRLKMIHLSNCMGWRVPTWIALPHLNILIDNVLVDARVWLPVCRSIVVLALRPIVRVPIEMTA
jgi:hypothetical protein